MPLRRAAEEMRTMYAHEIAAAVAAGRTPDPFAVESWIKYDLAARAENPAEVLTEPPTPDAH